jgi:hypothetical protein
VSQKYDNPREHYETAGLPRKSTVSAWAIVGLAMLVFAGLMAARSAAGTSMHGTRTTNPTHNSQCAASSSLTLEGRCPKAEWPGEPETRPNLL